MTIDSLAPVQLTAPEKVAEVTRRVQSGTQVETHPQRHKEKLSQEEVERIVRDVNEQLQAMHTELNFSVDKETEKLVLKIINSKTHEVIR
ncbi:MAG TPA: flagellar protein FlaG, partial [Bacteroidota bacterium]|nr:flagellar protein FlaG [Bacteroidota bacterium]